MNRWFDILKVISTTATANIQVDDDYSDLEDEFDETCLDALKECIRKLKVVGDRGKNTEYGKKYIFTEEQMRFDPLKGYPEIVDNYYHNFPPEKMNSKEIEKIAGVYLFSGMDKNMTNEMACRIIELIDQHWGNDNIETIRFGRDVDFPHGLQIISTIIEHGIEFSVNKNGKNLFHVSVGAWTPHLQNHESAELFYNSDEFLGTERIFDSLYPLVGKILQEAIDKVGAS